MGLIKQFLDSRKQQKTTTLSLEEENKQLKEQIAQLQSQIKEMEYLHAEEITAIDREFLTWYSKQNNTLDKQDNAVHSQISRQDRETDKQEQEPLDLEAKTDELEIGDLIND